jgi:Helicase conserved C-terminal domain
MVGVPLSGIFSQRRPIATLTSATWRTNQSWREWKSRPRRGFPGSFSSTIAATAPRPAAVASSFLLPADHDYRRCRQSSFSTTTTTISTASTSAAADTTTTTTNNNGTTTTTTPTTPENRHRRNAAKFLAVWLRDEPSYFAAGLKKLQITQQNSIYYDSIPSFVRTLKEGPPVSLFGVLDRLVEAGLHQPEVYERYQDHDKHRLDQEKIQLRIKEDTERLESTTRQQKDLRHQLSHERNISLPTIKTDRVAHVERQIDISHKELADLRSRVGGWYQRATDLEARMMTAPEYQTIRILRDDVCDAIVTIFSQHVADRNARLLHQFQALDARTDLTRPPDWFGRARLDRRRIIFHGGPTNSGKTYTALERLKVAKRGMYLGPLRLLAAEVYEKLTLAGIYCNLNTGQESREIPFATHIAATVEMANSKEDYDVVVIDEIQMIEDGERGYAWTRALLGTRCREIHVCGGLEAVDVIRRLVEACGDIFELRTYQRFSDLNIAERSLAKHHDETGCYSRVQKGDCVVAFSRNDIFAIKREIESTTEHKCCIVYGSLPPATRSAQARRFNDPDSGYDILVASDAIGMGLNLNIKRVILNSVYKYDGSGVIRLGHSAMKQISGRAGRRNSPFPNGGT